MPKQVANTRTITVTFKKSTSGTHVYKQNEEEGRHVFYFEKTLFGGPAPQEVVVNVAWK